MRWSLISTALVALLHFHCLLTACFASPIPAEQKASKAKKKAVQIKLSSKTYRKNSELHDYVYTFDEAGGVTRQKVPEKDRAANGKALIKLPNMHADHIFEAQMFKAVLDSHGLQFGGLDEDIQKKAREILNGPENMAPISATDNSSKGVLTSKGMEGKAVAPKASRDQYIVLSYPTARRTAKKLDELFAKLFKDNKAVTFQKVLHDTMISAKILKEGQPSPPDTSESDGKHSGRSSPASRASSRQSSALKDQAGPSKPKRRKPKSRKFVVGSPTTSKGGSSRSSSKSSGKGGANIRPHSPVASTSKLPGATSAKVATGKRGRSPRIVGKGKGKAANRHRSSSKSSGSGGNAASKRATKKLRTDKGRQK